MRPDPLSATFAALADPTRRTILARLAEGECSVSELAAPLPMSTPAVSKHLRVLERAGLVERRRDAQWRRCRLELGPLVDALAWAEQCRRRWESRLDRLDAYLRELHPAAPETRRAAPPTTPPRPPPRTPRKRKKP